MESNKKFDIFINENAGTVQHLGVETIKVLLQKSDLDIQNIHILKPEQFFNSLKNLEYSDSYILIGGGDGTINSAAKILKDKKIAFGILPMGTMNLLAKDLEIPTKLDEAIKAYADNPKTITIDTARVNDQVFLCSAAIGTVPESSTFREKNRSQSNFLLFPRLTWFILNRLDPQIQKTYVLKLDDSTTKIKSASIIISNNLYINSDNNEVNKSLKRQSLQEGKLGIYSAAPANFWDKIRILTKLGLGGWRKDPKIREWINRKIVIRGKATKETVSIDGETVELNAPLHFSIMPQSLAVLVPPKDDIMKEKLS